MTVPDGALTAIDEEVAEQGRRAVWSPELDQAVGRTGQYVRDSTVSR